MILLYAWIPSVLGVLLSGTSVGLGLEVYRYLKKNSTRLVKTKGTTLGVFGTFGAGKTTFLNCIGVIDKVVLGTSVVSYDETIIKIGEREIKIAAGDDIGGTQDYMKQYGEEWIEKKDIIVFIFNAEEYLNEDEKKREVRAYLDFIFRHAKKIKKNEENIVILASRRDAFDDKDNPRDRILNDLAGKDYVSLLKTNFMVADLREKKNVEPFLNRTFKNE